MTSPRLVLCGLGLVLLGGALACGGELPLPPIADLQQATVESVPNWKVENLRVDSSCATLLDYCVTVSCDVVSIGGAQNRGTAAMTLEQGGTNLVESRALDLAPGQRETLTHRFGEATLFGRDPVGGCQIQYVGTKALCTVRNKGGSGKVRAELQLILKDGSDATHVVTEHAGSDQTITLEHTFPDVHPRDAIRVECQLK